VNAATIEAFYGALFARDGESVGQLVDEHFADDVVLQRPESLPAGGRVEGARRVRRFMTAVATTEGGPIDVAKMTIVRIIEGAGDDVAVELGFPFGGEPTTALEVWTVRDLKVMSIKAYYWDTHAMIEHRGDR
jgi:ketosteroid isomerase-like protein